MPQTASLGCERAPLAPSKEKTNPLPPPTLLQPDTAPGGIPGPLAGCGTGQQPKERGWARPHTPHPAGVRFPWHS